MGTQMQRTRHSDFQGTSTVGRGISHPQSGKNVALRSVRSALLASPSPLPLLLGHGLSGAPIVLDLARTGHLLVVGARATDKRMLMRGILWSLLLTMRPEDIRLLIFGQMPFAAVPSNASIPFRMRVVHEPRKVVVALRQLVAAMERRYFNLAAAGVRTIAQYHQKTKNLSRRHPSGSVRPHNMPRILVVTHELSDILGQHEKAVTIALCRLSQMGSSCGIHLVLMTQDKAVHPLIEAMCGSCMLVVHPAASQKKLKKENTPCAPKQCKSGIMVLHRQGTPKRHYLQCVHVALPELRRMIRTAGKS